MSLPERRDHVRFYRDKAGEIRWSKRAANGEIIGASSEGFSRYEGALENAEMNEGRPTDYALAVGLPAYDDPEAPEDVTLGG